MIILAYQRKLGGNLVDFSFVARLIVSNWNRWNLLEQRIIDHLGTLAKHWRVDLDRLRGYYRDIEESQSFLKSINQSISEVPEFSGVRFTDPQQLRLYRCMLYLFTRVHHPTVFVETGMHNGFSSAFILLAMEHNNHGTLCSVDIPPLDPRMAEQGTYALPRDKSPGWLIPNEINHRHVIHLAPAEECLSQVFNDYGSVDAFLHDSDHSYSHMMFELGLAWRYVRKGGWIIVDNIEQNDAFHDFLQGVGGAGFTIASFDGPDRNWRHGLLLQH